MAIAPVRGVPEGMEILGPLGNVSLPSVPKVHIERFDNMSILLVLCMRALLLSELAAPGKFNCPVVDNATVYVPLTNVLVEPG
jgi:hypothetical protein